MMTPEDEQALVSHAREIAKILHRNAPAEAIETLEGIEKTVRGQLLEHV
ncbi:ISKra4 family transposase, partial [Leptolyngbyaceae cyanobacterium UHCC 1019]